MITNGDFWALMGTKIMGTRGKIDDVIHHLSPKVSIIFLGKCGNFNKIWCKVIPNQTTESLQSSLKVVITSSPPPPPRDF